MGRERILLRVEQGCLAPADGLAQARLRDRGFRVGDVVSAVLTKPRSPGYHRYAHKLGELIAQNIESFEGMDPHSVLKRLQWEAGIGCDEMAVTVPGFGLATVRWPRSLSFGSMDQSAFEQTVLGFCRHIASTYWPDLSPEEVAEMAEAMPQEVA